MHIRFSRLALVACIGIVSSIARGQTTICEDPHYRNHPLYSKYCSGGSSGGTDYAPGVSVFNPKGSLGEQTYVGLPFWILYKIGTMGHTHKVSNPANSAEQQAYALNEQGVNAYASLDFAGAANYFQQALDKSPNDAVIRDNLQKANLAVETKRASEARREELARSLDRLAEAVRDPKVVENSSELAFIGSGNSNPNGKSDELQFMPARPSTTGVSSDPNVVDARNIPSRLPKSVDDTLARVFRDLSPDAMLRLRIGWEAVMVRDWKVADALFEDALNHDPTNPQLNQFLKSFRTAMQNPPAPPSPKLEAEARAAVNSSKEDEELKQWWVPTRPGQTIDSDPDWREQARFFRQESNEMFDKLLKENPVPAAVPSKPAGRLQKPRSSDVQFLMDVPSGETLKSSAQQRKTRSGADIHN